MVKAILQACQYIGARVCVTMPIIIKCHSCGFVLYEGNQVKSIDDVLRQWGFRCPCCLSTLDAIPKKFSVEALVNIKRYLDIYNHFYWKVRKKEKKGKVYCTECGKEIQMHEIYIAKDINKIWCLKCLKNRLTSTELEILKDVVRDKYGVNLETLLKP